MFEGNVILNYLNTYGLYFLFLIVFLEYMNLPGLPAGIIMPAIGALIANSKFDFWQALLVSVVAGVLGSLVLYLIGYSVGSPIIKWIYKKFPSSRKSIDKVMEYSNEYGDKGIFICRLLPVVRTIISLVSGSVKHRIGTFILYSVFGVAIWNFVTIMAGFLAASAIIK